MSSEKWRPFSDPNVLSSRSLSSTSSITSLGDNSVEPRYPAWNIIDYQSQGMLYIHDTRPHVDGLMQGYSIPFANAQEILQSCIYPSIQEILLSPH